LNNRCLFWIYYPLLVKKILILKYLILIKYRYIFNKLKWNEIKKKLQYTIGIILYINDILGVEMV